MDTILALESRLVALLGWPEWALRIISALSVLVGLTSLFQAIVVRESNDDKRDGSTKAMTVEFRLFQFQYLGVYLTIMLADWLQGTNMFTLYSSYGVNVGTLFLTGFLSSA
eukprot:gene1527-1769_t